jgi:predicted PurR-regulated permease PerM
VPPLLRELTRAMTDFQGALTSAAEAAVGDMNVNFLGYSMNASQLPQAMESATHDWIGQPSTMLQLAKIALSTVFGLFLSVVLLFYFFYSGPYVMRRLLRFVPPRGAPSFVISGPSWISSCDAILWEFLSLSHMQRQPPTLDLDSSCIFLTQFSSLY